MLKTFKPPIGPSPGTGHKPQLKILDAEFGDGYSQPTPNGINHIKRTVSLQWKALTYDQMERIHAFFLDHQGTQPFYYNPFGQRHMTKWTCRDFSSSTDEGIWEYKAELVQSFTNQR